MQIFTTVLACGLFTTVLSLPNLVVAQHQIPAVQDYRSAPYPYSSHDPWTRSNVFNAHTGHAGFFYNCDEEECKRYSPYICWKNFCGAQLPARRGLWGGLKFDLAQVRRRIRDGSCAADGCDSPNCHPATVSLPMIVAATDAMEPAEDTNLVKTDSAAPKSAPPTVADVMNQQAQSLVDETRFGLLNPPSQTTRLAEQSRNSSRR